MNAVLIIGRVLFALICLNAGINHFTHGKAMVGYAQFKKVDRKSTRLNSSH